MIVDGSAPRRLRELLAKSDGHHSGMCISISVNERLDLIHSFNTLEEVMLILMPLPRHCSDVQENLMLSLRVVLRATYVPPNILQTLLNLAEFMEHEVEVRQLSQYTLNKCFVDG